MVLEKDRYHRQEVRVELFLVGDPFCLYAPYLFARLAFLANRPES